MSQTESEVKEIVRTAVRRKAGVRALQLIRKIVDEVQDEDRKKEIAAKWVTLGLLLAIVLAISWAVFQPTSRAPSHWQNFALHSYVESLAKHIEQRANARSPNEIVQHGVTGTVSLRIAVGADGQLKSADLLKSSGNPSLDNAALGLVRAASPLPPLPEELQKTMDILELTTSLSVTSNGVVVSQ